MYSMNIFNICIYPFSKHISFFLHLIEKIKKKIKKKNITFFFIYLLNTFIK